VWRRLSPWTRFYIVWVTLVVVLTGPPAVYALYVVWNEPCYCEPGG
jgi:hypothetical protein